jgi:hypothetical protein
VDITEAQLAEQYARLIPDVKLCVHAVKSQSMTETDPDGNDVTGVICRVVGHTYGGKIRTIDLLLIDYVAADAAANLMSATLDMNGRSEL